MLLLAIVASRLILPSLALDQPQLTIRSPGREHGRRQRIQRCAVIAKANRGHICHGGSGFLRWYDARLARTPLRTKMASSGLVSAIGDAVAQLVSSGVQPDIKRSVVWSLSGCFYFAPFLHAWYNMLATVEAYMRRKYGASKTTTVLVQFVANQTVGAAIINFLFCFVNQVLRMVVDMAFDVRHAGLLFRPSLVYENAVNAVRSTFFSIMMANWIIWPIPSFINLWYVPLRYRVLFNNFVALVWKTVLSLITAQALQ